MARRKKTTENDDRLSRKILGRLVDHDSIVPNWFGLKEDVTVPARTRTENSRERLRFGGPGLELLRRLHVQHLRAHMEVFYEHGSDADLVALCAAFDLRERGWREAAQCKCGQATLLEAILGMLGLPPRELLKRDLQRRPKWPL